MPCKELKILLKFFFRCVLRKVFYGRLLFSTSSSSLLLSSTTTTASCLLFCFFFHLLCEVVCFVAVMWLVLLLLLLLLFHLFSSSVIHILLCALGSTHFNTQFRYCVRRGKTKWPQSSNIKCTNLSIHNRRQASSVRFTSFP